MKTASVTKAINEAKEFIKRAESLLEEEKTKSCFSWLYGTKSTGAVRRQSLELTRALAEMRKPE